MLINKNKTYIGGQKLEIKLLIKVYSPNNKTGLIYTKSYESSIAPSMNDKIKDSLFAEYKNIVNVVFDYANNQCLVTLESKEVPDDRLEGHIQEVAELHKWIEIKEEA